MKLLTAIAALATAATLTFGGAASAQDVLRFAVVPKAMNNPFFDLVRDGCQARAAELGGIECVYLGPVEHEAATQAQIIDDLITQGVDGLAISVLDAAAAETVVAKANAAGIPVITFDSGAGLPGAASYVGTDNKLFGQELGKALLTLQPAGGKWAAISGGAASPNLADRVDGVREALAGSAWVEVEGSPTFSNDDTALAVQQAEDLRTANPDLKAIVPVGGWPMFAPDGWKNFVDPFKADVDSKAFMLVVADTLPQQLQALKDGYAHALVGQRPYEMGQKVMDTLLALSKKEPVDPIVGTGADLVTPENVDEYLK